MEIIQEGKAKFYASIDKKGKISKELDVFYNPVMKFNRDVSVLFLNSLNNKNLQVADIMAGSGVRSLRFLLELKKGIMQSIIVNDFAEGFIPLFEKNLELNKLKTAHSIIITQDDANKILLNSTGFNYIDVDPFGSPNDFLNSSVVRLAREGILAVTATDTAPLAGTYEDACLRKYWAKPLRNSLMHEIGLRILIRKIQLIGTQHEKALIPVYSYFKDHYFRIFFVCEKSKKKCDELLKKHKYVLYCPKCMKFRVSDKNHTICDNINSDNIACNTEMDYAGPVWTGDLYDEKLAGKIVKENEKSKEKTNKADSSFLNTIHAESKLHFFGFYDVHAIAQKHKITIPSFEVLIDKIKKKKYLVSRTHFSDLSIKTNMPLNEFIELMKEK